VPWHSTESHSTELQISKDNQQNSNLTILLFVFMLSAILLYTFLLSVILQIVTMSPDSRHSAECHCVECCRAVYLH